MSAEAWIALGALAFAVLVQAGVIAFLMGRLFAEVAALKARPESDCKAELAILATKFEALEATLKDVAHDVKNMLTGKVQPARRSAS